MVKKNWTSMWSSRNGVGLFAAANNYWQGIYQASGEH